MLDAVTWVMTALRLPSEAEWEYAARGATTTPFNTGACPATVRSADRFAVSDGGSSYSGLRLARSL